jgi:uncharacterized protein (TIGR03437 family)
VQWDIRHVRLLNPITGQLLREHLRQARGGHRIQEQDRPQHTPMSTQQLLCRADHAGSQIGALCRGLHREHGETAVRRILGVLSLAKKHPSRPDRGLSWIEIFGTYLTSAPLRNNCASVPGSCWTGTDFINGVAPTSLDHVSVSIGGQAAFIDYTSPGQINAQVPSNAPIGSQLVTVTNSNGTSPGFPIIVNQTEPGWLAPAAFTISGKQYVAILSDGTYALPANAISGVPSRPAHIGETVTIYGIGFGPVTGGISAGTIVPQLNSLTLPMDVIFGPPRRPFLTMD